MMTEDIENLAIQLCALATARGRSIELANAVSYLTDITAPHVRVSDIQEIVAMEYGVTVHEMKARRGSHAKIVRPRHIAYFIATKLTALSFSAIGHIFGNRDRTTILYGVRRVKDRVASDTAFADEVALLIRRITGAIE